MTPAPYYLRPKATKLPAGHDDSLDTDEGPTDPATRALPPNDWPVASAAKGGTAPPDKPLSPPAMDPARRSVPASTWPTAPAGFISGRAMRETMGKVPGTLDPDIALWQAVVVSIWPFTGAPTEGEFPQGWLGIDNTSTVFVCTVAGEPGTWVAVGGGGSVGWPTDDGTGSGNLTAQTDNGDSVGYNMTDEGSGGIKLISAGSGQVFLRSQDAGGVQIQNTGSTAPGMDIINESESNGFDITSAGGLGISDNSAAGLSLEETGTGGLDIEPGSGGMTGVLTPHGGATGGDTNLTESFATYLATASLGVGKWLITAPGTCETANGGIIVNTQMIDGTATATFAGVTTAQVDAADAALTGSFVMSAIAIVTVAGTVALQAKANDLTNTPKILAGSGYTAVRIA